MWALGGSLFTLLFAGAPIGIALAGATALLVLFDDFLTYSTLFEAFFSFLTKYTLVAIPFFIFAGFLMEKTGLVASLFKFADSVVGWVPGGFAYATLLSAVLFGAIGDPKYDNDPSAKVRPEQGLLALRKALELFANIRPVECYPSLIDKAPLKAEIIKGTDFVIYRELTGGIYFGEKQLSEDQSFASDLCGYHQYEIERIAHLAFKAAQLRRNKVTLVDKANVLESSRLWRRVVKEVASNYPEVSLDFLFVDNAAMQMVLNPSQFDVVLTENMFGDILSDEGSVIGGSIGLLASASVGNKGALFEPIHGSYPQAKGLDIANPVASILSAAMLLEHLNLKEEASSIRNAVMQSLEAKVVTKDLDADSTYGTEAVGSHIASLI